RRPVAAAAAVEPAGRTRPRPGRRPPGRDLRPHLRRLVGPPHRRHTPRRRTDPAPPRQHRTPRPRPPRINPPTTRRGRLPPPRHRPAGHKPRPRRPDPGRILDLVRGTHRRRPGTGHRTGHEQTPRVLTPPLPPLRPGRRAVHRGPRPGTGPRRD